MSEKPERKEKTDIWELYCANFAPSDESRDFVLLPMFDCGRIPGNTVKVVQANPIPVIYLCGQMVAGERRT